MIKCALRRRSAIEPVIGQMTIDGHLGRCHLKGREGDAANVILTAPSAQPAPHPRLAEGSVARNLDGATAPARHPDRAQLGFLTDDSLSLALALDVEADGEVVRIVNNCCEPSLTHWNEGGLVPPPVTPPTIA
jgi:hypothetical protein